jgi:hypothetical protein
MMLIPEVLELAAAAASPHRTLLASVRELAAAHGVEVVSLRMVRELEWSVRVRLPRHAGPALIPAAPGPVDGTHPGPSGHLREKAAAVVSPVRGSIPFNGDGSDDILRFVGEADQCVIASPLLPGTEPQVPCLGTDERLRYLASAVAGDVLLSMQHQGRVHDGELTLAIAQGREQYEAELDRSGCAGDRRASLLSLYDSAARETRVLLGLN